MAEDICCPRFDPEPWENKEVVWNDKMFIKDRVKTVLHVPVNFSHVITRMMKKVDDAKAQTPDYLCLSDHTSKWNMDIYLAVEREIPGANNVKISGKYLTKVYEGSFNDTGKWCKDLEEHAKAQGAQIKKMYMWYTTCPKCAKKYGKNYVVIVGQV